ncbi:CTLH/CRA C-terminal to lish motif domain-containing protein [Mycena albidolilacea]|uniref:CTLH/CRA C-terminal to lish motif domain-containing protein n=1 Tax=Mycena albidolilacea TaxID=1033008 RepID=A0AAD7AHI7_9AGAR|nr:CTLH/CRA C-terminal to lish motif domain-containing protein [Mycena albidolilacea]
MANKLNVDGILLFEQPFARVPYENYRKVFRTTQRHVERDLKTVQVTATDLAKQSSSTGVDSEAAVQSIDAMISTVENLKRKLAELHDTAGKPTQDVIRERLQHLATVENIPTASDPEFGRWADTRLDRWLVDWALRNGKEKTARMIAKEKHIETLVDIDLFSDIKRIEGALSRHSCSEALAWCSENKTALRKQKSTLEFDLRLQEYIELARAGKRKEAIDYSKKHLVAWQETHLDQIQQALALLAVRPDTSYGRYKRLYDPNRWRTLTHAFRLAIYALNTLPTEPLLHLSLYAGLASLKLPACMGGSATKNVDCPVCDFGGDGGGGGLGTLAQEVPFSHHANSTIVCYITGKIMDADNMPLAFPDTGYVYSREAMEEMSLKNDGVVTCPRSKATCKFSALRRVYIS